MGWNFVKVLSEYHELHILTESKFRADIDRYLAEHAAECANMHFYFISKTRHRKLRKLWPPSYYWFYKQWQKKAFDFSKKLNAELDFDLVHQLNMVGYREPGYLYRLGKPLVWGPISGFNITPWKLLPSMGLKGALFFGMRNVINSWQMNHSAHVAEAVNASDCIISATQDDHNALLKLWNKDSVVIPEVGFQSSVHKRTKGRVGKLKICWSGLHMPRKSLNLLLEALALLKDADKVELHVIGAGECTEKWKRLSQKLGLTNIIWHGWVEKTEAMEIMSACDVFAITSLSDATSTVLLEALSIGLPVVATNHLGFANVVNDDCGIKIDLKSHKQVVRDFASSIEKIEADEPYRQRLSHGALEHAKDFSWESKAKVINKIYESVIKKHDR